MQAISGSPSTSSTPSCDAIPDGTLHPALATAWQRTGPTTWHFTLRPDVRWHDGTRFTAVDAKYSLDRTFDASVKAARLLPLFQTIDRTEAPDAGDARHPHQATRCAHPGPTHLLWADGPLGVHRSGRVHGLQPAAHGHRARSASCRGRKGDRCVLEANPDYWDGRLDLDRVVFRPVPAPAARVEALLRGDADLITQPDVPSMSSAWPSHPATKVAGAPVRRPLRARGQRLGRAAQPPPRPASPVAGDRPARRS